MHQDAQGWHEEGNQPTDYSRDCLLSVIIASVDVHKHLQHWISADDALIAVLLHIPPEQILI